jgi:dTDP-4-dehydrorhamnose reductase
VKRVLVTGAAGQLGWELARRLPVRFPDTEIIVADRGRLDLSNPASLAEEIRAIAPDVILNAAAYTAVDQAETDAQAAFAVNAEATRVLARHAAVTGAFLFHYSTDYVFDGTAAKPYVETDAPHPLGVYGASKLAGEKAIEEAGCAHLILRTSWVYGLRGKNFLLTMRRLAKERDVLRVVDDQRGVPNWCGALAQGTADLLALGGDRLRSASGLYHFSCRGDTTWYEFARRLLGYPERPQILPITTAEYPLPARRPAYGVLSSEKLERTFGLALPRWEAALDACLQEGGAASAAV